ncbi:S1/P1 Nuclease [Altericroceibacterium spongiae]|uniref:S1/P1 Nuclease n=1 Tax=Altericroceibacterium spongiae TaxID=2320269 RepID=A0A420ECM6_9SPHN|nr:S1/P1 nuclease [Altericroceibacterium spongiae]RKF18404.1 S1/P1 Nuclease [Altericroceibacterium spongiae]
MIRFSPILAGLGLATILAGAAPAYAWGPIGHRVSAEIAQRKLDGRTSAEIEKILRGETLVELATLPDEMRSDSNSFWQKTSPPYHYVTLPEGRDASQLDHPPQGDAVTALELYTQVLRDSSADIDQKKLALAFVVHIVADLHMPLHVGNGTDRGGNDFKVLWFGELQNLHWVWDEGLILHQQLSFTEYADRLDHDTSPDEMIAWWGHNPLDWIDESAELRGKIYPVTSEEQGTGTEESPVILSWDYAYRATPQMERRLAQSAVRTAAYLEWTFAHD